MKRTFLGVLICICLCGCHKETDELIGENFLSSYGPVYEHSLLQGFVHLGEDSLRVWKYDSEIFYGIRPNKYQSAQSVELSYSKHFNLLVAMNGHRMTNWTSLRKLLEPIGDIEYKNGKFETYIDDAIAFYDTLSAINVTCTNASFDEQHPQGSSLNDILTIYVRDWGNVIRNGYKVPEGNNYYAFHDSFYKYPDCYYVENLSTFDWSAHTYTKSEFLVGFNKAPQNSGEYVCEVELKSKDGKVAKASTEQVHIDAVK